MDLLTVMLCPKMKHHKFIKVARTLFTFDTERLAELSDRLQSSCSYDNRARRIKIPESCSP